jgi:uncharacterized protein YwbE
MLHHSAIPSIIEQPGVNVKLKFIKSTGQVVECNNVVCTSSHFRPRTYNVRFENGEIRKVKHVSIIEVNGEPIYH